MTNSSESCRIAVTTDLSADARSAYPVAGAIARAFEARLLLVHQARLPGPEREPVYQRLEEALSRVAADEEHFSGLPVETHLLRDERVEALLELLQEKRISLLCLATHGQTGDRNLLLGSFTEKMLRVTPCPVLVCPSPCTGHEPRRPYETRRILVASDLSPGSVHALFLATSWAQKFGAVLRLLSVVEKASTRFGYREDIFEGWWQYLEAIHEETHRKLEEAISEFGKGIEIQKTVKTGYPAEEILRESEEFEPDLLVLGTHGRAGLEDFLLGSVSRRVVARAPGPVLVVRPGESSSMALCLSVPTSSLPES